MMPYCKKCGVQFYGFHICHKGRTNKDVEWKIMPKRTIELTTVERAYLHDLLQDQINNHEKDKNILFLIDKIMYKIEEKEVDNNQ